MSQQVGNRIDHPYRLCRRRINNGYKVVSQLAMLISRVMENGRVTSV